MKFIGDLSQADAMILVEYATKADRILEFGVGGSTQIFAQSAPTKSVIMSVETDPEWTLRTQDKLVRLDIGIAPVVFFYSFDEWRQNDLGVADLIFVDGRDDLRFEFAIESWRSLKVGGHMIFHDTRRPQDMHNVLNLVSNYFLEVASVHINHRSSNMSIIEKKLFEPYVNWNWVENKQPWEYGAEDPPDNWPNSPIKE